jgi:hypothetical protein
MTTIKTLRDFEKQVRAIERRDRQRHASRLPEGWRPFLCEGSPLKCTVFLAGINPGRNTGFWSYWLPSKGCDKSRWLADYRKNGKRGRTREYIEILWYKLQPYSCLETNLYPIWTNRAADLDRGSKSTEAFDFLLKTIKPRMLFLFGRPVRQHVERLAEETISLDSFQQIRLHGQKTSVYAMHHLCYQLKETRCHEIGAKLRKEAKRLGLLSKRDG